MKLTVFPADKISGVLNAPPSKAQTLRALFGGLLSEGTTTIFNPLRCDDTETAAKAISLLGAKINEAEGYWRVQGAGIPKPAMREIHCGLSGVTLRFLIPVSALPGGTVRLTGEDSLMRRPIAPLLDTMQQLGVNATIRDGVVELRGDPLKGGIVRIRGDVSSQFVSGLLFAGSRMSGGLRIELTSPLESRNYVKLTIEVLARHAVKVKASWEELTFEVAPGQIPHPTTHQITGDYSGAAFAISAAAITRSRITLRNLKEDDLEPDVRLLSIVDKMGGKVEFSGENLNVEGAPLRGIEADIRDTPDLGPVLAVLGCYAEGETHITGAGRLRYKESDRLQAIALELNALGAQVLVKEDTMTVSGPSKLHGGIVDSHNDHRIAMSLAVAALGASGGVTIIGGECVSKSYPRFFDDMRTLGVKVLG